MIDGRIEGDVRAAKYAVEIHGEVEGEVHARHLIISGSVHGNVFASEKLELRSGAALAGDVQTASIAVEDRARLHGSVRMGTPDPADRPAEAHPESHEDAQAPAEAEPRAHAPVPSPPATPHYPGVPALPFR